MDKDHFKLDRTREVDETRQSKIRLPALDVGDVALWYPETPGQVSLTEPFSAPCVSEFPDEFLRLIWCCLYML